MPPLHVTLSVLLCLAGNCANGSSSFIFFLGTKLRAHMIWELKPAAWMNGTEFGSFLLQLDSFEL